MKFYFFFIGESWELWRLAWRVYLPRAILFYAITAPITIFSFMYCGWLHSEGILRMYPNARTVYIDQLLPINSFLLAHAEDHDGVFPQRLQDVNGYDDMLERICSFLDHPEDPLKDAWGNEIVYESSGDTFKLISYGRDGVSGGEGLDEDLVFLSRRSIHRHSTLFQFLTNKDQKEINNGPMWNGSFVFSLFPAFLFYFYLLDEHAKNQQIVTMSSMWIFGIVLMVVSLLMGYLFALLQYFDSH